MASHRGGFAGAIGLVLVMASAGCARPGPAGTGATHHRGPCSAGAHTLSAPGSHVYPETGNGGYQSLHTGVHLVYDAASNRFLAGNHVTLTDRAAQCLTSFSLDFERRSVNASAGPDLAVTSVTVNGRRAAFRFVQPTYPGDPHGQNDRDPRAHEASQLNPVGGPAHNPLPPACTPEHAGRADRGWGGLLGHRRLHGQARRAQRRGRDDRGLVPLGSAQRRRRLRHHRARRHRGLDAAQRLSGRQADLRLL